MNIILYHLPKKTEFFWVLSSKFGINIKYYKYFGNKNSYLKNNNVTQIELDSIPYISQLRPSLIAMDSKIDLIYNNIIDAKILDLICNTLDNIKNSRKKAEIIFRNYIGEHLFRADPINVYVTSLEGDKKYYLLIGWKDLFLPGVLRPNIYQILNPIISFNIYLFIKAILGRSIKRRKENLSSRARDNPALEVCYFVHDSLNYGGLYEKTIYYEDDKLSRFAKENIIHFDYSGCPSPDKSLNWINLSNIGFKSKLKVIAAVMVNLLLRKNIKLLYFSHSLIASYTLYKKQIKAYDGLKIALIDYDVLCPKSILLALESLKIKTIAIQERFMMPYLLHHGTFLNCYLVASDFILKKILHSKNYYVDEIYAVGQYKSDWLVEGRSAPPVPLIAQYVEGKNKIVIALGFHVEKSGQLEKTSSILNWRSQKEFINDIISLAVNFPDVFFIFRFKELDWLSNDFFKDVLFKIDSLSNICISDEYANDGYSYKLCAYADAIIAKHTSLADECLCKDIPVIFHEYSHNYSGLISEFTDLFPKEVMAYNYLELKNKLEQALNKAEFFHRQIKSGDLEKIYSTSSSGNIKLSIKKYLEKL